MSAKLTCEECAAELPANAPQGLCPRCLAGMGLHLDPQNPASVRVLPVEQIGDRIGRYELLQKIGERGVWQRVHGRAGGTGPPPREFADTAARLPIIVR